MAYPGRQATFSSRVAQLAGLDISSSSIKLVELSIDDKGAYKLERYGIEIGGGIGPVAGEVWRIGLMGHTARQRNVTLLLGALAEILGR